jgi:NADH-ubiquinone oxidoreductase chain 5
MNRLGDMGLSIGFLAMFSLFGSLDYSTIFSLAPFMNETAITIIGLLLLMGAMAKSAQIPLHTWLPGSMEGPTPVSALIHAATLVTAGLYLLVRSSPILEYSPTALLVITLVGATSAFINALCGLVQNDIKAIIAFSTLSQLGYMLLAVGLSKYDVSLFHVINHAFFKALLFLSAGTVIHSMSDQQDIRRLGGLINFLPFTYTIMLIGSLSLLATPWLTGFYSKDLIIELAYAQYGFSGYYAYILGSITAGLTAYYSFRLISLTFLTYPNAKRIDYLNSHEASISVVIPLTILALFSIFFGYIFSDLLIGMASDFLGNSVYVKPDHITLIDAEFSLPIILKLLPAILSVIGATLGILLYHKTPEFIISLTDPSLNSNGKIINRSSIKFLFRSLYTLLNRKFLFDIIYNKYIISGGLKLGYIISKTLDKGLIEIIGPYGVSNTSYDTGNKLAKLDTGIVTTYALYISLGLITLLFLVFSPIYLFSFNLIDSATSATDTSYGSFVGMDRIFIIYFVTLIIILTS